VHLYDLIIDIAGNSSLSRLRRALTPTGSAVIVGGESKGNITGGLGRQLRAMLLTPFIGQRLTGLASKERATDSEVLAQHISAGTVTPSIDRTYPLAQVPTAMRHLEGGTVKGKIAITI
jgi:NADPH:quinone reductase-like Zn-dependent oxidoreductase